MQIRVLAFQHSRSTRFALVSFASREKSSF
jgi:hypothetical protein